MGTSLWNILHQDTVLRISYRQGTRAAVVMVPFMVRCKHMVTCFTPVTSMVR